jgi:hypothetical protein
MRLCCLLGWNFALLGLFQQLLLLWGRSQSSLISSEWLLLSSLRFVWSSLHAWLWFLPIYHGSTCHWKGRVVSLSGRGAWKMDYSEFW